MMTYTILYKLQQRKLELDLSAWSVKTEMASEI